MSPKRFVFIIASLGVLGAPTLGRSSDGLEEPEMVRRYLARIAPMVARRSLTAEEISVIETQGAAAISTLVEGWLSDPALESVARDYLSRRLSASGRQGGIDFELPGNLAAWSVRDDQPWATILTAATCRDETGSPTDCGSEAPFSAGVLTTRAFLASRSSRFNLTRSSTLLDAFACRVYPQETSLQPPAAFEDLIQLFQTGDLGGPDGSDPIDFGNGQDCYSCHGQFSVHAQLFVRFDESGLYRSDATGLQDEDGELGRSVDGLMASHFRDPARAGSEASQFFGVPVAHLGEAARVLAESPVFLPCQAQHILVDLLGLQDDFRLSEARLEAMVDTARGRRGREEPTFSDLVFGVLTDPWVVSMASASLEGR